jgi:hypothetical protein
VSLEEVLLADLVCSLDRRLRRFPAGAACACEVRDPLALVSGHKPLICRACLLLPRDLAPTEEHHLGGRPSQHTIVTPVNAHAVLSFLQGLWRGRHAPGSNEAYLFDLVLARALGPTLGVEQP